MSDYFKVWEFWASHAGVVIAALIMSCLFFLFEYTAAEYLLMVATLTGIGWVSLWANLAVLAWVRR